ncbi:hypothetical protein MTBLM1_160009 [Rhodospirillaceae bacterium LM-1]|nr:hypothetical protein MTBLM1_160009 [Rhodospirillaceae bacterium LM-1]
MNDEDLMARQEEELQQQLIELVEDWASRQAWDCGEEVSSIIADTNSIFTEDYIDEITVDKVDAGKYAFTCRGELHGEPRKDDVPFCGDTIYIYVEGSILYDEDADKWEITDYSVSAELEDYADIEDERALSMPIGKTLIPEYHYKSADDLISKISQLSSSLWFRGHGDVAWELKTAVARQPSPSVALEKTLRLKFENQTTFLDPAAHPLGIPKCNFLMQHHGLPTRLLDWTTSPLTALYFAVCSSKHDDKDGCLWALDPSQLNKLHKAEYPQECDGGAGERLFTETSDRILAIHAPYTNLRMKVQQSEFTLHTNYKSLEKSLGAQLFLKEKIIIDRKIKEETRKRLRALGTNRASLFPDLDNIAQTIKDDVLEDGGES